MIQQGQLKIEIDEDQFKRLMSDVVRSVLSEAMVIQSLPPILNKEGLMRTMDIGATKASELLNREDFPVTRALGQPRILTHLLLQWLEDHTDWVEKNAGPAYFRRRGA